MKLFAVISCLLFNATVFGANILFLFCGGNISHKLGVWPLVRGLAEAGHNVTFVSSGDRKLPGSELVRDFTPAAFKRITEEMYKMDRIKSRLEGELWDLSHPGLDDTIFEMCEFTLKVYKEDPEFRDVIDGGPYDLAILNSIFYECSLFLTHRLGLKVILYSPSSLMPWFYGSFGAPVEASSIPQLMAEVAYPQGLLDRMWTVYRYTNGYTRSDALSDKLQALFRRNFKTEERLPSLIELERNASLVFLNTHYSTDFARSLPPVFVNVGGMQCWEAIGKLPDKEMEAFINGAQDGVVLITFGSTIDLSTLDQFYVNIFFETMRKFSTFRFIWRWDGPMPEGHPTNLMASKWLPQREILSHPKTVAFMTHGGLNGINEATFHGIPLIVLPLFSDQDFNAYRIQAQGLGIKIELREFSQALMDGAFKEVLENKKYKKNMEVRSEMFKDRRMSPVKEAIFWTEFVLRQDDTSALKPMLLEQPWHVRNLVDVYFAFFLLFTIFPLILLYGIIRVFNMIFK